MVLILQTMQTIQTVVSGNTRIEVREYLKDASVKTFGMVFK